MEAALKAEEEYQNCRNDIHNKGKETLEYIEKNNLKGIVLAGRPYHVDPEINHGIDTLITSLGLCVLTEDSIANLDEAKRPLRVVDQWMFHARLYAAAEFVGKHDNLAKKQENKPTGDYGVNKIPFTQDMRKDYTILVPQMAPIHFELITAAVGSCGYNVELLSECTPNTVETGLKYVNNL